MRGRRKGNTKEGRRGLWWEKREEERTKKKGRRSKRGRGRRKGRRRI
jgi:hypothetical protein